MNKRALLVIFIGSLALTTPLLAKEQAANFENGKVGTDNYERLSFYVNENGTREIELYRGKNWNSSALKYLGVRKKGSHSSFGVSLPSGDVWEIIPQDPILMVRTKQGSKKFKWAYEGPVDGKGTFCESCVDETEAVQFVKDHFAR